MVPAIRLIPVLLLALACTLQQVERAALNQPVEVALAPYLGRLVTLEAVIGRDTAHLLFDTGGGETIISPGLATKAGCTPTGRSTGFRMTGERIAFPYCSDLTLSIGGISFTDAAVGVWDVAAVLPPGSPPVDGVLSLKTLAAQPFTLDLNARRLTLETPQSLERRVQTMTRLRSRIATGPDGDELTLFVRGATTDTGWFLMDSGNLDVVQAGPHLKAGSPAVEGTWEAELTLDGLPGRRTTFRTRDIIYDGALSEEFLRQWIFAFDLSKNGVWATPSGVPSLADTLASRR